MEPNNLQLYEEMPEITYGCARNYVNTDRYRYR